MPLKLIHTADWHLGQLFYEYDRTEEHAAFLRWLKDLLVQKDIDVLVMSGDVFDVSNPSAASMSLYYNFLRDTVLAAPHIQIIITAGNHDSAGRLEAPRALLQAFNIHVVGLIPKNELQLIDHEQLVIPLKNKQGAVKAWCMAIPFLRQGDYPVVEGSAQPYAQGVTQLYRDAYAYALSKKEKQKQKGEDQTIIAMGHLHALHAEPSTEDKSERAIMGGVEFIPASAFHDDLAYTALGHIHKAQKVAGKEQVRYAGSPLPMSFAEINYRHQVVYLELEGERASLIEPVEVPVHVQLLRIPQKPKVLFEVLAELSLLPEAAANKQHAPFLEVRVLLDQPEPALKHKIETAIEGKHVRLARIHTVYSHENTGNDAQAITDPVRIQPVEMLNRLYQSRYATPLPAALLELFQQTLQSIAGKENNK